VRRSAPWSWYIALREDDRDDPETGDRRYSRSLWPKANGSDKLSFSSVSSSLCWLQFVQGCKALTARSVPMRGGNVSLLQIVDVVLFPRRDCRGEVMI
jgi:hypothetical protein